MRFAPAVTRMLQVPLNTDNAISSTNHGKGFIPGFGATQDSTPGSPDFNGLIYQLLEHYHVPGLALSILDGNKTFTQGYGMAQFPDVPITPDTIFYGASTTKAFVAAGVSLLVDDDDHYPRAKWTTPISELIRDDFVLMDDYYTQHVTLEDAASHRSGLPRHDFSFIGGNQTVKDVVRSMRYLSLTEPIRTKFQYCNLMFITLGHVIETLTGQWLGKFLAERIWEPLSMTSTYFSLSDALQSGKPFARGQYWLNKSQTFMEVDYVDNAAIEGAGAVLSSVVDYSKWVRMMINRDEPISKAGHEALVTPHMIAGRRSDTGSLAMYGYGWELEQHRGYDVVWHNGGESGFGSLVLYVPQKQWGCVMMSNCAVTSNILQEVLAWHLVDELLETPMNERTNRTAFWDAMLGEINKLSNATYVRELVYPSALVGNVSASLPLEKYAGAYFNPGYGEWHIQYENGTLRNNMHRGPVLQYEATLEHISGDHFLIIAHMDDAPDDPLYIDTEFEVTVWGKVERLGLGLETAMGGGKIWFDRLLP